MPTEAVEHPKPRAAVPFDVDATRTLEKLRSALAAVIEAMHPAVGRASDLQKRLGLDKSLSWNMYSAASTTDLREVASNIPGERAFARFVAAAAKTGVPSATLERLRAAFVEFEKAIERHVDDRETFEAMVSQVLPGEPTESRAELRSRRDAFRANSVLWRRQMRTSIDCVIHAPSAEVGRMDQATIMGVAGLRQTGRQAALRLAKGMRTLRRPGSPTTPVIPKAIDPREDHPNSVGLLRDFCSQPLPEFRVLDEPDMICHELVGRELGKSGEVTYFTGHVLRGSDRIDDEIAASWGFTTPTELAVCDVLIHKSLWDEKLPELTLHEQGTYPIAVRLGLDVLPTAERPLYLGLGIEAARSPDLPRHAERLQYVMDRLGWDATAFRVFRVRTEYPILHTRVRVRFCK